MTGIFEEPCIPSLPPQPFTLLAGALIVSPLVSGTTSSPGVVRKKGGKDVFLTNHLGNPNLFPSGNNSKHNSSMAK